MTLARARSRAVSWPAPRARPAASSSRGCATRVTGPGSAISSGHGVPAELDAAIMAAAREFFALPRSRAARARDRELAALPRLHRARRRAHEGRQRLARAARRRTGGAGAARRAGRARRGGGCADRTNGPRGYPRCSRRCSRGCARWTASGSPCCARSRSGSGQPLDYFDGFVLPRGDPHLKIIRYPAQPRGARHTAKASACTTTRASCRSCCKTTSAACRSSSTASSSTRRRSRARTS